MTFRKAAVVVAAFGLLGHGAHMHRAIPPAHRPHVTPRPERHRPIVVEVTATAYNARDGQEWCGPRGCGSEVFLGGQPYVGTVAVSHDLKWMMGRTVRIRGWKYVCRDLMASRWHRRIDIYMGSVVQARMWGVQTVTVEVPR